MRMSDWSSDVCSSDLDDDRQRREDGRDQGGPPGGYAACRWRSARGLLGLAESGSPDADHEERRNLQEQQSCGAEPRGCMNIERTDRKGVVSGKSVSVGVDLGGRRNIKKNK